MDAEMVGDEPSSIGVSGLRTAVVDGLAFPESAREISDILWAVAAAFTVTLTRRREPPLV